jgi:hypothetical protein
MYITNFLNEQRQHEQMRRREFLIESDRQGAGRGMESKDYATCPHCDRATVLIVHEYTPQLFLGFFATSEPQTEGEYYTCEWCEQPIDRSQTNLRMPSKPAASAGWEDDEEWARRVA